MFARSGWTIVATLACACLAGAVGCGQRTPPTGSGAVAVIDLDQAARRLGADRQISASLNQRQSALNQKLVELARNYTQQIEDKKKTLPQADADQTKVQLATWQQQANANLNQVKLQAEQNLESHRAQLMTQFREQIKPAARKVAAARGLSVIVTNNDAVVFDFASRCDITDDVVAELIESQASAVPAAGQPASTATAPAPQAPAPTATR